MTNSVKNQNDSAGLIGAGQAGRLLGISTQRLRQLAAEGHIPKAVKGKYPLVGAVQGYIKFLRDAGSRPTDTTAVALVHAKRKEVELRVAERQARLIETDIAEVDIQNMLAVLKDESTKATEGLDSAIQPLVAAAIRSAIKRAEERATVSFADLRAGREPLEARQ